VTNAGVVPVLCALRNIPNVYVVPAMLVMSKATFTHTTPLGPYRGAGRPEASYVIERLMDDAARKIGIDPVELRRRNYIPPSAMPVRHHGELDVGKPVAGPTTLESSRS
jgi:carbon-monoxide dehydrogenase large subunit